jgi:3-hydroxypropanoate dehydrogenase
MSSAIAPLSEEGLDLIFRKARTFYAWKPEPVSDALLHQIYDLYKFGPTSFNTSPARILFLRTEEAKARLLPALMPLNVEKSRTAPVVAIVAYDTEFYEQLPKLVPHMDAKGFFVGNAALIQETAFRNGTLQGAYLMIAARAVGLDCGPMSGFDAAKVNAEFFPDGKWKADFVCNLGHGDPANQYPRAPRLEFEEACRLL